MTMPHEAFIVHYCTIKASIVHYYTLCHMYTRALSQKTRELSQKSGAIITAKGEQVNTNAHDFGMGSSMVHILLSI